MVEKAVEKETPLITPSVQFFQKLTICNDISYPIKLASLLQFEPLFSKYGRFLYTKP